MAQHGYLGDGYGTHGEFDRDRDEQRDHRWEERDQDRERRDEGFLFGENEGDRSENRRSSHYGREHRYGGFQGDYSRSGREQGGFGGLGDYQSGRKSFSANPDEHYRSWRDRHMAELDRDYEDYCREREQQFHQDFDTWRGQREGNRQPLRTGMTQTGSAGEPSGTLELTSETATGAEADQDPTGGTAGTTPGGRGRR